MTKIEVGKTYKFCIKQSDQPWDPNTYIKNHFIQIVDECGNSVYVPKSGVIRAKVIKIKHVNKTLLTIYDTKIYVETDSIKKLDS